MIELVTGNFVKYVGFEVVGKVLEVREENYKLANGEPRHSVYVQVDFGTEYGKAFKFTTGETFDNIQWLPRNAIKKVSFYEEDGETKMDESKLTVDEANKLF